MKEALIILGDQLFPVDFYSPHLKKTVFMAEDVGLCTHFKYHKHKIIFFLSSMRHYSDELKEKGFKVHYEELSTVSFIKRLSSFLESSKISEVTIGEVQDKFFEKELFEFFEKKKIELTVIPTPMFLCSRAEFKSYLGKHKRPFMKSFYEGERKRLGVLLDANNKPEGGEWSYDTENRKKAPKVLTHQEPLKFEESSHLRKVKKIVDEKFSTHPGDSKDFWLPSTRADSLKVLKNFSSHNLENFGDYQDAITPRAPFLYHSIISPMVNAGLLTPKEVIHEVLKKRKKDPSTSLASVEGFVRQVMGWREFVRGIYQNFSDKEESTNFFKHEGKLTKDWYEGTTGIPPVDDAILKANKYGYCHHIERLMVLSNIMLLCELHPKEVHRWFMEMFVDSADWVMGPNVYGMGQFSDGGIFATKPYISGSNYILKMSDYKKGDWSEIWDGLYWRFIHKNAAFFGKNPRMAMMVKTFEKMEKSKKDRLLKLADQFIKSKTK